MTVTPDQLNALVSAFIANAIAQAQNGMTFAKLGRLVIELLQLSVSGLESIPAEGKDKKKWALSLVGTLFDSVAGFAVPVYLQPFWFVAKPGVRILVLALADGALEQVLRIVRTTVPNPDIPQPGVPA